MITKVISNDFYHCLDSVLDREDAQLYLYGNFSSLAVLMECVDPNLNHGPFILKHGDLHLPNIMVDEDLNIVSVLDWEFSHTIPFQMFVPPFWLTNKDVLDISRLATSCLLYRMEVFNFLRKVRHQEYKFYNPEKKPLNELPLYRKWKEQWGEKTILIPYGLLKPITFQTSIGMFWTSNTMVKIGGGE